MNIGLNAYKKSFSGKAKDNFDKGFDNIKWGKKKKKTKANYDIK